MTTVQLTKVYDDVSVILTIDMAKVEETIKKDLVDWFYPIAQADWPSSLGSQADLTKPRRECMDLLNVTREWTITGFLYSELSANGVTISRNVLDKRDQLINMLRSGGPVTLFYGIPSDVTGAGYTYTNSKGYYSQVGFNVYITSLMIQETAKGGSSDFKSGAAAVQVPEVYEITMSLRAANEAS
jgi:hypothetical protein